MTYYDLLKQYVSTGDGLTKYQLDRISKDKSLLGTYFYSRSKFVEYYEYEYTLTEVDFDFLKENRKYLSKFSKDGVVYGLLRNGKYDKMICDYIWEVYRNDLNYLDVDRIAKNSSNSEFFGKLYNLDPELFETYYSKVRLVQLDVVDRSMVNTRFRLKINIDEMDVYIDYGNEYSEDMIERILTGDGHELYEADNTDWVNLLDNYVNDENEGKIRELVNRKATDEGVDIEDKDLEELIGELDYDEIMNALNWAANDTEVEGYIESCRKAIKNALDEYGNVERLDNTGAIILVDLMSFDIDYESEECEEDDLKCLFKESTIEKYDFYKPRLYLPDNGRFSNSVFNNMLKKRLSEIG